MLSHIKYHVTVVQGFHHSLNTIWLYTFSTALQTQQTGFLKSLTVLQKWQAGYFIANSTTYKQNGGYFKANSTTKTTIVQKHLTVYLNVKSCIQSIAVYFKANAHILGYELCSLLKLLSWLWNADQQ